MSLDICVPVFHKNLDLFLSKDKAGGFSGSLICLERNTEVPFRLIVMVDGGVRDDFVVLESYLKGAAYERRIIHERQPIYYTRAVKELFAQVKGKMVALVPPEVTITDANWFGKMQLPFMRDPNAMAAFANQGDTPNSLPPYRLSHKDDGEELLVVMTKYAAENVIPENYTVDAGAWSLLFSRGIHNFGGNRWGVPSVRRFISKGVTHGRSSSEKVGA